MGATLFYLYNIMRLGNNENQKFMGDRNDNYSTPKEAWELVIRHIDTKDKKVWCPFYNEGLAEKFLKELFVECIHNDKDFFEEEPNFDYIIDNPPYTIKQKIFERCVKLDKPFALLVPIDTLERKYMNKLFKSKDLSLIIPNKRYNFINGDKKTTPPFKTIWVCYGFNLDKQIIFEE